MLPLSISIRPLSDILVDISAISPFHGNSESVALWMLLQKMPGAFFRHLFQRQHGMDAPELAESETLMMFFQNYELSFRHTLLYINGHFMSIYHKNNFAIFENGKTFELQFVCGHPIYDIASYLFSRILTPVV